jgi:Phage holin family Hol44, in holin superfamily V
MFELNAMTAILIAVLIGISQVAKELGLKTKYIPLLNLVLGIVLSAFFITDLAVQERILQGLIIGLSASGLFDQSKLFKGE